MEPRLYLIENLITRTRSWESSRRFSVRKQRIQPGLIVMKFGEQLRSSVIKEYQWYYIAYNELKELMKKDYVTKPTKSNPKPKRQEWTEEDESKFITRIESELDKVYSKQKLKVIEISRRIQSTEREVHDIVARLDSRGPVGRDGAGAQEDDAPTEEEFMMLEEDLNEITADVNDLAKFVQLNYTGFQKIIKKHDKQTRWILKPVFATRLKAKPFFKDNYDADIVKLSKLWDIVRTRGNPVKGDSAAGGSQGSFIRQTTKYWIHPDNVTEVKLIIMKHLPVLVFNTSKEFDAKDSAITSIYYDNTEKFDLYEGRLKKTEGAEAIRLRWYGGMDTETIFVERKTHREDWTGEKSVKARFAMKEKNVNSYLKGDMLPEAIFEKARKDGKKPAKVIDEDERLAKEIQYSVLKKGYKPLCRSFYNRTAFQLPADARVRISLDTELTMVREDNLDGRNRAGKNWRRMDIGIDYPFSQLPPEDAERFPYAILEVKLQTQAGQEPPSWVRELIASHLVEAVPKFSKFIHGTATLFPTRIHLLPFWMPQMDVDIRKPANQNFGIQRPGHSNQSSTSDDDEDDDSDDEYGESSHATTAVGNGSDENVNRLRETRDTLENRDLAGRATGNALDIEEQLGALPLEEAYPLYDSDLEDDEADAIEEARRVGGWPYYSKLIKNHARLAGEHVVSALRTVTPSPNATRVPLQGPQAQLGDTRIESKRFKAPKGKKIHVPVRVEPKVYFAAERTFLSWLEFSIYISTIATTLLNFGSKPTKLSFLAAGSFSTVAVLALFYSVIIYLYRSQAIRTRKAIKYHDSFGPTALCTCLFVAVVLNMGFELKERNYI
ncbi:VTC domain-containing protein [Amylocarpus encephaloides]|uniref:Vacuolar transporter chaperone complex subunit 4 n=1 Tax=Amylocarpus encephaloides TaxID=45428 RepID=A0A9P8C9Q4_9HELO|nr:VTC domain-containing protein [Amylocarpus encephaloides]